MQRNIFRQARSGRRGYIVKKVTNVTRVNNRQPDALCDCVTFLTVVTLRMLEPLPDEYFMREALRQAQKAYATDEVPVGAVVVRQGKIIARAHNQVELLKDATAHAEMLALTEAEAAVGDWRLTDCDLYVTKEPCSMCAGAVVHTRIRRVIFGCLDPSAGAAGSIMNLLQMPTLNHRCAITSGVLQKECAAMLQEFFRKRREEAVE
jgi:tRNA(adenine34) deaminase